MLQYEFALLGGLSEQDVKRLNQLLLMLSVDSEPRSAEHWDKVCQLSHLLLARDSEQNDLIVGMGTLVPCWKPTKFEGRIEDVVVDEAFRGQGIGRRLSQGLIDKAKEEGIAGIELTSSPMRQAANHLYQSLGFKQRNSNVYQMEL